MTSRGVHLEGSLFVENARCKSEHTKTSKREQQRTAKERSHVDCLRGVKICPENIYADTSTDQAK